MTPLLWIVAAVVATIVAAWFGGRRAYRAGYAAGYAAMNAIHERYRAHNKSILAGLQNATNLPAMVSLSSLTIVLDKVDAALAWLASPPEPSAHEIGAAVGLLDGPAVQGIRAQYRLPRSPESRAADHFPRPHSHEPPAV